MHAARYIYETAPLGSLIRYGNGQPRPPERFKRKLRAWESANGVARLVKRRGPTSHSPASFTLHLGDFESRGVIVVIAHRSVMVDSDELFEIVERPAPGMVRVLTRDQGDDQLRFLAANITEAQRWMDANRYSGMRIDVVPHPDPIVLPDAHHLAA